MLKAGQKVTLLKGGGGYPLYGFKNNEAYEVLNPLYTDHEMVRTKQVEFLIQLLNQDSMKGYARLDQLNINRKNKDNKEFLTNFHKGDF